MQSSNNTSKEQLHEDNSNLHESDDFPDEESDKETRTPEKKKKKIHDDADQTNADDSGAD